MKQFPLFMAFVAVLVGCSDEAPESAVNVPTPKSTTTVAVASPSSTPAEPQPPAPITSTTDDVAAAGKPSAPSENQTLDIADLFAPPKAAPVVIKEPEREPEKQPIVPELPKQQDGPPPDMRLIGFSEMDELKALVSIDGKLNILALGQTSEGVELIGLEPPAVTLKYGETEIKINLNDQPWTLLAGISGDAPGIGAGMALPNKPPPVPIPGVKRFPAPPSGTRQSTTSLNPSAPNAKNGVLDKRFPAASPPPVPPPARK